ncbi:hypothetical protein TNCV_4645111 [Trichonephila clavipes]|nr:hypothetical protein TNCV_4645111 [Trichonephila clavipes]
MGIFAISIVEIDQARVEPDKIKNIKHDRESKFEKNNGHEAYGDYETHCTLWKSQQGRKIANMLFVDHQRTIKLQ